jgi:hypothetical protein
MLPKGVDALAKVCVNPLKIRLLPCSLRRHRQIMHALRFILGSHPRVKSQVKDDDSPEIDEILIY